MHLSQQNHPWFALQVIPRHELKAASVLRNKGFEEYVPLYETRHQWSDRKKTVRLPLFTGYVFCRFDPSQKVPIVTTPGVIRVVGSNKRCTPIADHEIESIQKITATGKNVEPHPYSNLRLGCRVRVQQGPLAGCEGMLIAHRANSKLILSMDLIQRSISVEIEGYAVVSVKSDGAVAARAA